MKRAYLLLLACPAAAGLLYFACGGPAPGESDPGRVLATSRGALTQAEPLAEPDPKLVEAAVSRHVRAGELVESLRKYVIDGTVKDVTVKWNHTDNLKLLFGDGLAVSLGALGCSGSDAAASILCFLGRYQPAFGIDPALGDLKFISTTKEKDGSAVYRFRQHVAGREVRGSDVVVTLDAGGNLTRVYSRYVAGIEVALGGKPSVEEVFAAVDRTALSEKVGAQMALDKPAVLAEQQIIYVDLPNESKIGVPSLLMTVETAPENPLDLIVDAATGEILEKIDRIVHYAAKQINKTSVAYPQFTSNDCGSAPWYLCWWPFSCSFDMDPVKCVKKCTTDADCNSAYAGWKCWPYDPIFPNYCYRDGSTSELEIYSAAGWVSNAYSYLERFMDLKNKMDEVMAFHYEDLGRSSWNNADGNYITHLPDCCRQDRLCSNYFEQCSIPGWANGTEVTYATWANLAEGDIGRKDGVYNLLSHEWAHNVVHSVAGGGVPGAECLSENVAQIYGSLLAVKPPRDTLSWQDTCNGNPITLTPWRDQTFGLAFGCAPVRMPYAQRSRFDWIACSGYYSYGSCTSDDNCLPYEKCLDGVCTNNAEPHRNDRIWRRFVRVLAEGPSTFAGDGNGEYVGSSFTAVGWPTTVDVVYDATTNLGTSTTLEEWVDLLISAGFAKGVSWAVNNALGVVGFISLTGNPASARSDRAPYEYYFSGWSYVPKTFYVWKNYSSYDLKVQYYNGVTWVTDTISANTSDAPAVAEYNSRLHIFWRDRTTGAVKFMYYRYDGTKWGPYDLGPLGISTAGSFDAAVFNGYLYIVYALGNWNSVYLSKCLSSTGCYGTSWHDFGSANYKKFMYFYAFPGMALEAGPGLNGTGSPATSYLYIASASSPADSDQYRIRIDQMGTDDNLRHGGFVVWMPNHYPSYKTYTEIGMTMMKSAFPDKNYLYLAWRDATSTNIYKAVVQNYDDVDNSSTWLTRSDDTFLDSYTGVRLMKGYGPLNTDIKFDHTDTAYYIHYSILYGRY